MFKNASSSAAAVRAAWLDPTPFTSPRDVRAPGTRLQRLYGAGMLGWNVFDDLPLLVMPLLQVRDLTQACDRALVGTPRRRDPVTRARTSKRKQTAAA